MCRRKERQGDYQLVPMGKGGDAEGEELLEPPLRRVPSHWDVPDLGSAGAWKHKGTSPILVTCRPKLCCTLCPGAGMCPPSAARLRASAADIMSNKSA